MTDSDSDVPELISSDDEENPVVKTYPAAYHAARWLEKNDDFLAKQELWNRVFCLGPFLFGVNNIIAAAWIKALSNAKLILDESRQFDIELLKWEEWECVDLVDDVIRVVHKNLRDRETLSKVIDLVHRLEMCRSGLVIDIDLAIEEAEKVSQIADIWRVILSSKQYKGKEKAAKFAVLYIVKIYREHVLKLGDEDGDFVETTQEHVKTQNNNTQAEENRKKGNELFGQAKYLESVVFYTKAAKQDPFCHIYYGNRAQAYHKLDQLMGALADGRRAVTIKPDFAKGHFRYAKAFRQLGRLTCAIKTIQVGLQFCQPAAKSDSTNVRQLEELLAEYQKEDKRPKLLTPIPDKLRERLNANPVDGDTTINDMLGVKVPPTKRYTGDLSMFNDTAESCGKDTTKDKSKSTSEKETKKMRKKKQLEEEKRKKEQEEELNLSQLKALHAVKKKEGEEKQEFETYLKAGSEAVELDNPNSPKNALSNYRKALDMIINEDKMKLFGIDETDVVTLKYALGMSAVKTGLFKNLNEAVEKFKDIIDNHQDIRFPLAYFGLGKAYVDLFRFSDALEPLEDGKTIIARNINYVQVTWPGTNNTIQENESNELLNRIQELILLCKTPPAPETLCRHHTDKNEQRLGIYLNDPGFKGYMKITCQMYCVISFHVNCWKTYKQIHDKVGDKDVIDTLCPTPDCTGFIMKLEMIRPDGISKEFFSSKYTAIKETNKSKKPSVKQRSSSETKLVKKQEKKEIRKLKKKQKLEESTERTDTNDYNDGVVITDGASASAFIEEIETQPLPTLKDSTVLIKEDAASQKNNSSSGKSKRSRKKKDKTKQILNMEVNFSDRKEENLLNENSAVSDGETNTTNSRTPFSVPSELKNQINTFEQNYQGNVKPLFQPDEVTENLFSYFGDILQANGPLAVNDTKILQELEVFPPEALDKIKQVGGLSDFLKQSLKFAVIDDVISLLSDAKRAREIALLRRSERENNSAPVIVPVNAWTTVGKITNNVDSLKESTFSQSSPGLLPQLTSPRPSITSHTSGIVNSSSSSSLVSVGSDIVNLSQSSKPASNGLTEPYTLQQTKKEIKKHSAADNLDSIDDFPSLVSTLPRGKTFDDLDAMSDPDSDKGEVLSFAKSVPKKGSFDDRLEITLSRSSSHSDLSGKSSRSDFSSDLRPKPLRPLGVEKIGLGKKLPSLASSWDKLESDFDSSWNKVKKEEFEAGNDLAKGFGSVGLELKQATEDFVKKSDEKFVSELAESVVDKLYQGKFISETERKNTLDRVSTDIWKDFEKSADTGKLRGPGLWADTPVGQDYSNNLGKFASDFMKKHYEQSNDSAFSPTSTLTSPFPPVTNSSVNDGPPSTNTPLTSSWSCSDIGSLPKTSFDSFYSGSSSGYNLFSGPTWGFDTFSSNSPTSSLMQRAIRPPNSATSYYQRNPASPNGAPGLFQSPAPGLLQHPAPRFLPNVRMPPPFPNPYQTMKSEKKEIEIQATVETNTVGVMTDSYEPFKVEYLKMKEELNVKNEVNEKLSLELKKKEQTIKEFKASIMNKESVYDYEKKSWVSEKTAYSDKILELKHQLENKENMEKAMKDQMQGQEKKVNDLSLLANERTKDLEEIKKLQEKNEKCQKEIMIHMNRAVVAEIELLRAKFISTKGMLERSQKGASYHNQHFTAQVSKLKEEAMSVPPALQQTLDHWKLVLQMLDEKLTNLNAEVEVQIIEIKKGKSLAELPPVTVFNPPPIPETVKAYMNGVAGQMRMQRSQLQQQQQQQQVRPQLSGIGAAGNGPVVTTSTAMSPLPPKPLTLISSAPGLVPPRPLTSLRSQLSMPTKPPPLRPLRMQQPVTSFEKLMLKLSATFPNRTRLEFNSLIQELRTAKGGSLSGMTMEDIVNMIGGKIGKTAALPNNLTHASRPVGPPPGINKSWAFTASGLGEPSVFGAQRIEMFQEEEDPCVICHEEMLSQPAVTLECNHTFHDECIRKWFQEQSTCPNCRVHTLLSDEFPSLNG